MEQIIKHNYSQPLTAVQTLMEEYVRLRIACIEGEMNNEYFAKCLDTIFLKALEDEQKQMAYRWIAFDWNKPETRPTAYGKYLIQRKDGKHHWETWNGNGWAYNHNEIRFYADINPAKK